MITVPGYKVLRELFRDHRTVVYQGLRVKDGTGVSIKSLLPEHHTLENIDALLKENAVTNSLDIDGILRSFSIQNTEYGPALIFEDFGGLPLMELANDRGVPLDIILNVAVAVADILGELHQRQIIHGNITPFSILFNRNTDKVKLTNFGPVSSMNREHQPERSRETLPYISPEQTGRINRAVDYRTDFYSLGVTFYQLLTGNVPFMSPDVLSLIHSHLAKEPAYPIGLVPGIPEAVFDIILKLLAKNPEDRYQSGHGLKADLQRCLGQLKNGQMVEQFPLGSSDIPHLFAIPQKLYGRDQEVRELTIVFDRACTGEAECLLVSGHAGCGKTALIAEIKKLTTARNAYYITGKYDQLKKDVPYSAVIQAFRTMTKQILTESEESVGLWRERILKAIGINGRIVTDVIPDIELIIGRQPPTSPAGPTEVQNRFNRVIQKFVGAFAAREHPLVLFLDDLQWVDPASVSLIKTLVSDPHLRHFFIVGAYRDNEVPENHPLTRLRNHLEKGGVAVTTIQLGSLGIDEVNELLADTLKCRPGASAPLARIVKQKTGGNPFFVHQMVRLLYEEKMLHYEGAQGWQWNLHEIQRLDVTDNVINLLIGKISKLPAAAQEALKLASCIGSRFDLDALTVICERPRQQTYANLRESIQEGLVIITNESYLFFHDRIQEAAYSLMHEHEKKKIHYKIGSLVFSKTKKEDIPVKIFYIADQLNAGSEFITDQGEKYELAELNLLAGKKAKASTAYASAVRYLIKGIALLAEDSWADRYQLTIGLYRECSECEYLNGNFELAEELFETVLCNARTNREKAEVYTIKTSLALTRGHWREALEHGNTGLQLLGHKMPASPGSMMILFEILRIKSRIRGRTAEQLLTLPAMHDPDRLTVVELLMNMAPPAYFSNKQLFCLVMLNVFTIFLKHGQTSAAPLGFATYGFIMSAVLGRYREGHEYALLAVRLCDQAQNVCAKPQCDFILGGFVNHWTRHIRNSVPVLVDGYRAGLETGNFVFAGYCAGVHTYTRLVTGDRLEDVQKQAEQYLEILTQVRHDDMILATTAFQRAILSLRGLTRTATDFSDDDFEEMDFVQKIKKSDRPFVLSVYQVTKLPLLYLFGAFEDAVKTSLELDRNKDHLLGMFYLVHLNFYSSLALAAQYPVASSREKNSYWKRLRRNQKTLKNWAKHCPDNFLHRSILVKAEMARLRYKYQEAEDCYDQAIQLARTNEFVQEEAIGNELAAGFYLGRGREHVACAYLLEALRCYRKWGAAAKVKQLEEKHRSLLEPVFAISLARAQAGRFPGSSALDLMSVVKSSQAISREISLDKLPRELMKIMIENAGARRGVLILEREGRFSLEAEGTADKAIFSILGSHPFEKSGAVAESVVRFSVRTGEEVVLNNAAAEGVFTHDQYIRSRASKSILCTPIMSKGKLIGTLYLENDLISHAFTPDRVEVVNVLSSQIAISLENARLYEEVKNAKDSLQESEQKFRTLAETMKAGIVIYRENEFLYVNPAAEQITGYSLDEFRKMNFSSIVHPDFLDLVRRRAADRLAGRPTPAQYEFKIVRKDGEERWLMSSAARIEYGREQAMITSLLDITNDKSAEQERHRLYEENVRHFRERIEEERRHQREKENILMDIHDGIGGITTNIGMLSEVARKMLSLQEIRNTLTTITNLAREGTTEIRSLMISLDSRDHSWHSIAAELQSYGARTCQPYAMTFKMTAEIPEDAAGPGGILFLHLFRIYREALTNVIKHAGATRVSVRFSVTSDRFVLSIHDDGRGCDKTELAGNGRGVKNMKQRAAAIGGVVEIIGESGTRVMVQIPLSGIPAR